MTYRGPILFFTVAVAFCLPGCAQTPVGELWATDASVKGAVVMSAGDTRLVSGSVVTAGETTASLRLARGGEVHICPHSSLSVTASQNGRQLMLALGSGTIEVHYNLGNSADTILTPDFRILLAGPGEFHSAIASDARGNTCIRALQSNTASIIVNELLGEGAYQVGPGGQALFHGGSVKDAEPLAPDCTCPPPPPTPRVEKPVLTLNPDAGASSQPSSSGPTASLSTAPLPAVPPSEVHVSVDAPFVFRATEAATPPPPMTARLSLQILPPLLTTPPPVEPPPLATRAENERQTSGSVNSTKKGLIGHISSWLSSMFHRSSK